MQHNDSHIFGFDTPNKLGYRALEVLVVALPSWIKYDTARGVYARDSAGIRQVKGSMHQLDQDLIKVMQGRGDMTANQVAEAETSFGRNYDHPGFATGLAEQATILSNARESSATSLDHTRVLLGSIMNRLPDYENATLGELSRIGLANAERVAEVRAHYADARAKLMGYLKNQTFTSSDANGASGVLFDLSGGLRVGIGDGSMTQWQTGSLTSIGSSLYRDYDQLSGTAMLESGNQLVPGARQQIFEYQLSLRDRTEEQIAAMRYHRQQNMVNVLNPIVPILVAGLLARIGIGRFFTRRRL